MDKITRSDDPLEQEIAILESAIANENADFAELEGLLVQKQHDLQMLSVEVRTLKRAASLRPIAKAAEIPAPALVPTLVPVPESHARRFRNVVAQIRTTDPRLAALPGG